MDRALASSLTRGCLLNTQLPGLYEWNLDQSNVTELLHGLPLAEVLVWSAAARANAHIGSAPRALSQKELVEWKEGARGQMLEEHSLLSNPCQQLRSFLVPNVLLGHTSLCTSPLHRRCRCMILRRGLQEFLCPAGLSRRTSDDLIPLRTNGVYGLLRYAGFSVCQKSPST